MHSSMLSEALSDWGLLELLLGELRRRAKILRKAGVASSVPTGQRGHARIQWMLLLPFQNEKRLHRQLNFHSTSFCPADFQQPPGVEATETLLTSYMLQVVSSLTLRTIKNTGEWIAVTFSFFNCQSVFYAFQITVEC